MLDRLMLRYSSYKDDLPSSIGISSSLNSALEAEDEILDALSTYVNSDSLHKETKEFDGGRGSDEGSRLLHLHHDVVFLGFPLTAIDFIADKWIHLLQRDEHILSTINNNENVIKMPGDIMIRNHYNLVKSSFHVADAINSRIKSLASSNNTINIWEMEEILQSLSEAIITSSVQKDENNENEIVLVLNEMPNKNVHQSVKVKRNKNVHHPVKVKSNKNHSLKRLSKMAIRI